MKGRLGLWARMGRCQCSTLRGGVQLQPVGAQAWAGLPGAHAQVVMVAGQRRLEALWGVVLWAVHRKLGKEEMRVSFGKEVGLPADSCRGERPRKGPRPEGEGGLECGGEYEDGILIKIKRRR